MKSKFHDKKTFAESLSKLIAGQLPAMPEEIRNKLVTRLDQLATDEPNLWEAANILGSWMNSPGFQEGDRQIVIGLITRIREEQGYRARYSDKPTLVVFGTSGWRGVIGEDFTVRNVHKVVRGICRMMQSDEFLRTTGLPDFLSVQEKGILLLRDNRFMGDEFMAAAMLEIAAAGIKIYDAGECPTGVGSALLTEIGAAGSINFTPSHNPMEYAGIKFNPADGGPADVNLTSLIELEANTLMNDDSFEPAEADFTPFLQQIDAKIMFRDFVEKRRVFDLAAIRTWLNFNASRFTLVIDFMHGAARGFIEYLLGDETISIMSRENALQLIHAEDDFSFHGVKPEPGAANMKPLIRKLQADGRQLNLAVALDPDADRIRFADTGLDIDMNRFGALAYAHFLETGRSGGVASTAPSSDFALQIARQKNQPVFETAVGFKYFRPALGSGQAVVAFEESDGISFKGHTLEKCALAGFLAALDIISHRNQNLSAYYAELQKTYGYFYPGKAGAEVRGVSVEAWQSYKKAVLRVLQSGLKNPGDSIAIGETTKKIASINSIDGLKIILEDYSWILLRPSGTEPKFRYYFELASPQPIADPGREMDNYRLAAEEILTLARKKVDETNGNN